MKTRSAVAFIVGALSWSASEYAIHRFIGHGPRRKREPGLRGFVTPSGLAAAFNTEHLAHHSDPQYFASSFQKAIAAVVVTGVAAAVASAVAGSRRGCAFALGFGLTYVSYEVLHRRVHTHAPTTRYGRWRRRHHLYHHHQTPRQNHGVTSALWDHVFGTKSALPTGQPLRVPRKLAPPWLIAPETGLVRPELASDYVLVGSASS